MILGYIIVGMIAGCIAAGISLFVGATFWWVLITYSVAGALGTLLAALFVLVRSYIGTVARKQGRVRAERWSDERDLARGDR